MMRYATKKSRIMTKFINKNGFINNIIIIVLTFILY